jgi:hypothetical protein
MGDLALSTFRRPPGPIMAFAAAAAVHVFSLCVAQSRAWHGYCHRMKLTWLFLPDSPNARRTHDKTVESNAQLPDSGMPTETDSTHRVLHPPPVRAIVQVEISSGQGVAGPRNGFCLGGLTNWTRCMRGARKPFYQYRCERSSPGC